MVAVFAIFGTLDEIDFKQMGVGLSAAILIDATIIRGVLLPSTLVLLGERAWYLPRRLGFLAANRRARRPRRSRRSRRSGGGTGIELGGEAQAPGAPIPSAECAPSWPSSNGARVTSRSF